MDTPERTKIATETVYDGFISYSHSADDLLAPRLQAGLQRFAKPWWKRRAVRIFRDESSLAANPHLWSSIVEALESSGWFVLLLSPDAANSEWVNKEIEHWKATKPADRILPVVTDGEFGWSDGDVAGSSVPPALHGVFSEEPRWVDLRFARNEEHLDLQNPTFSAAIADIASAIRGVPKDELESEEVRQHRKTVRTAWAAGALVTVLAVASVGFGVQSSRNAGEAERQTAIAENQTLIADANAAAEAEARADAEANASRALKSAEAEAEARALARSRELAASAIGVVDDDPELATLLAIHAIKSTPEGVEQPVEVINALWEATARNRLAGSIDPGLGDGPLAVSLSASGDRLMISDRAEAAVIDATTGKEVARYVLGTEDEIRNGAISPDGTLVALPVAEPDAEFSAGSRGLVEDQRPARLVIVSAVTGEEVVVLEYPDCKQVDTPAWSADGLLMAVSSGPETCVRNGSPSGLWVEVIDTSNWSSLLVLDVPNEQGWDPVPAWDRTGRLFVFGAAPTRVLDIGDLSESVVLPGTFGYGDVNPSGSTVISSLFDRPELQMHDVEGQEFLDVLPIDFYPSVPREIRFSSDGGYIAASIRGEFVTVWDTGRGAELFTVPGATPVIDEKAGVMYTAVDDKVMRWTLTEGTSGRDVIGELGDTPWVNGAPPWQLSDTIGAFLAARADFSGYSVKFFDRSTGALLDVRFDDPDFGPVAISGDRFLIGMGNDWVVFDPVTKATELVFGCEGDEDGSCPDGTSAPDQFAVNRSWDGALLAVAERDFLNPRESLVGSWSLRDAASLDSIGRWDVSSWPIYDGAWSKWQLEQFSDEWGLFSDEQSDALALNLQSGDVLWQAPVSVVFTGSDASAGLLWVYGADGSVRLLDAETWAERHIQLGLDNVRAVSFSLDSSLLAAADQNRLKIFDVVSGSLRQSIPLGGVSDVLWLDDQTIVIGTSSGLWARISLDPDDLVEASTKGVTRPFSDDECRLYRIDPCPTLEELKGE